jgi:hypothetical protein
VVLPVQPPLPEPIFAESITDIDSSEANELEVEINGSTLARHGARGFRSQQAGVEFEYRALPFLGFALEPQLAWTRGIDESGGFAMEGGVALSVLRYPAWDLYGQVEGSFRWTSDGEPHPGSGTLPFGIDLRGAKRFGVFTLRPALGATGGGIQFRAAPRASVAGLFSLFGGVAFAGAEVEADLARSSPFTWAAELVTDAERLGLPFKIGLAVPLRVENGTPVTGVYLRLFFESSRERSFSASTRPAGEHPLPEPGIPVEPEPRAAVDGR